VNSDRVLAPFGRRTAVVSAREQFGAYTVLRARDSLGPRPQAGQFYMLAASERWGGGDDERPFLARAFSVLRAPPGSDELHFLLEDVGPGTHRLCELGCEDGLELIGPLGRGFRRVHAVRTPLLVGGGVGIAPLAIWQDELGPGTQVLFGFCDHAHARGAALLTEPRLATDDGTVGHHGPVTELLIEQLDHGSQIEVYACGPPAMLEAVRQIASRRGIPAQLALEAPMACGFGACFGCVVSTKGGYLRLCLDGPVLDADQLDQVPV
jgi:dihydroorotate dehydrogenase electron transfer subunit